MNPGMIDRLRQLLALARPWLRNVALALGLAPLLLLGVTLAPQRPARAQSGCGAGPCIAFYVSHYTSGGQPILGGPASTAVEIEGSGFTAAANKTVTFGILKGNDLQGTSPSPSFCARPHVDVGASAPVSASGTFSTTTFYIPTGLSVGDWSVCAYLDGKPATPIGNTNNLAFQVSSPNRPTVSVSPATITSNNMVTVTGHGWVPAQSGINVTIAPCDGCPLLARYGAASSSANGDFSVQLPIPANPAPGAYLVRAVGSIVQDSSSAAGPFLTVAPPPATPAATVAPTATPFAPPTATTAPNVAAPTSGGGQSNDASAGTLIGLGALVAALLGGGLLALFTIRRRLAATDEQDEMKDDAADAEEDDNPPVVPAPDTVELDAVDGATES